MDTNSIREGILLCSFLLLDTNQVGNVLTYEVKLPLSQQS